MRSLLVKKLPGDDNPSPKAFPTGEVLGDKVKHVLVIHLLGRDPVAMG